MMRLRRVLLVALPCLLLVVLLIAAGLWKLQHWGAAPRNLTTARDISFPTGTSLQALAQTLAQAEVVDSALVSPFRALLRQLQKISGGQLSL